MIEVASHWHYDKKMAGRRHRGDGQPAPSTTTTTYF